MDSIIERLGLYEFFTDLLVGMITLITLMCFGPAEWFLGLISDTNLHYFLKIIAGNEFIASCMFIVVSCFWGMVVHEAAALPEKLFGLFDKSMRDYKTKRIRKRKFHWVRRWILLRSYSRRNFVTDGRIIRTGGESERYSQQIFSGLSMEEVDQTKKEKMQEDYFLKALSYLEDHGKEGKIHRIDGIFGMSRSLAIFLMVLGLYFVHDKMWIPAIGVFALAALFYKKALWYIDYRTREILRRFRYLHDHISDEKDANS